MVVKTVKYRSVNFKIVEIMDFLRCTPCPAHIQTVKTVAFHHILTASIPHRQDLRFLCNRGKALLRSPDFTGGRRNCRYSQSCCKHTAHCFFSAFVHKFSFRLSWAETHCLPAMGN
jgi:hypothetical protein